VVKKIKPYRYLLLFLALINLVITPLEAAIFPVSGGLLSLVNYSLVILVGVLAARRRQIHVLTVLVGLITMVFVWLEFFNEHHVVSQCRMISILIFFIIIYFILIRNFIETTTVTFSIIFGAMAGYILIGIIGGVLFELLDYNYPDSVTISEGAGAYDYYYYSFISMVTIGFGDIIPLTSAAKSLTILIGVIGQFYMAIGIAFFVGKHLKG